MALVSQEPVVPTGMRVVDYVLLGRTAHLGFFEPEGKRDLTVVASAWTPSTLGTWPTGWLTRSPAGNDKG